MQAQDPDVRLSNLEHELMRLHKEEAQNNDPVKAFTIRKQIEELSAAIRGDEPSHGDPLLIWRERLQHLLEQEAITDEPEERFQLRKAIEEAEAKIEELDPAHDQPPEQHDHSTLDLMREKLAYLQHGLNLAANLDSNYAIRHSIERLEAEIKKYQDSNSQAIETSTSTDSPEMQIRKARLRFLQKERVIHSSPGARFELTQQIKEAQQQILTSGVNNSPKKQRQIIEDARTNGYRRLDLSGSKLTTLISEIGTLKDLEELSLSDNRLTELPPEIGRLAALQALDVSNNPLTFPPPEVVSQGTRAILNFLRAELDEPTPRRMWSSKIIFLGEGGVGKTQLLRRLRDEEFIEGDDATHGVSVRDIQIAHPTLDEVTMTLNAWDFGVLPASV